MKLKNVEFLLADDDNDDCIFFKEALEDLAVPVNIEIVNDGEELMQLLENKQFLPDVLFLDLNMPKKNGFDCLREIKSSHRLENLPVIIFSTSFNDDVVNKMFERGATHYIQKPNEFDKLRSVIHEVFKMLENAPIQRPDIDKFVIRIAE